MRPHDFTATEKLRGIGLVARMAKRGIVDDGTVTLSDFAPGQ